MPKRVLVVEDDILVRLVVCHHLKNMGWLVKAAESGKAALQLMEAGLELDAVLADLHLPDMHGANLARDSRLHCPFVFMSGREARTLKLPGPVLYKPFGEEALREVFRNFG